MDLETVDINSKLVERAKQGDQQAMYRLYKMHVQAMYNSCIRIVANQFDAEDIIQESFVSAFTNLSSFRGDSTFGGWLKRIVINKSLNALKKKRHTFTDLENIQVAYEDTNSDGFPDVSPELIHQAIKSLPDKARVVLNLHLLEGYIHKEIAEMLDISESTSKSQYQRARTLLQEMIMKEVSLKEIRS